MKLVIHIISTLVAVMSILWLYAESGFEPLIVSLLSLAAVAGIGVSDQLHKQPSHNTDLNKYEFISESGIYKEKITGRLLCTSCLIKGTFSPLKVLKQGWQCQVKECREFYPNKYYKPKQRKMISNGIEL